MFQQQRVNPDASVGGRVNGRQFVYECPEGMVRTLEGVDQVLVDLVVGLDVQLFVTVVQDLVQLVKIRLLGFLLRAQRGHQAGVVVEALALLLVALGL